MCASTFENGATATTKKAPQKREKKKRWVEKCSTRKRIENGNCCITLSKGVVKEKKTLKKKQPKKLQQMYEHRENECTLV